MYNFSAVKTDSIAADTEMYDHTETAESKYIKYIDFNVTCKALCDTMKVDIATYGSKNHYSWVELLSYLALQNGGNFKTYSIKKLNALTEKLAEHPNIKTFVSNEKLYNYYLSAYGAILGGMLGLYENSNGETVYGLRAFSPIASGYDYSHYDDFGASRSYGYKREHLGHDLIGSIGTPIIAVESGYVEAAGWNMYGGWRIGIRSFDGKRYYYYAHLRKNHPYNDIYEGKIVNAGEVIGYLGMTGYSTKENTNNIDTPHLHYGLQVIFDPSQKEGNNQIWINMYDLTSFLYQNRAEVYKDSTANEYYSRSYALYDCTPD